MRARRKLLLLVVASAGLHGAGFAALAWIEPDARVFVPLRVDDDVIELSIERPRALEPAHQPLAARVVAPEPSVADEAPIAAHRTDTLDKGRVPAPKIRPPARTSEPEAAPAAPASPATPSLLAMRTPGRTSTRVIEPRTPGLPGALDLSPARAALAVHSEPDLGPTSPRSPLDMPDTPRVPGPRVERSDSLMIPDGNGTYRFDHPGFKAKVERDGSVHIEDQPSFQPFVEGPCLECVKDSLGKYVEDPSAGHAIDLMALLPKVGARFDLTDWVMRKIGDDPYSYQKARFLDKTRAEREAMRRRETEDRLREALQLLPKQLDQIWAYEAWTPSERRRALFELWDECAESGSEERVQLGRSIRATIIAFIRERLPAGSEHAYTEAELQALDRQRKSRARFEPYAPPTPSE